MALITVFNPARAATYYAELLLGEGGFGTVWSGHTSYGFKVAIKLIKRTTDFQRDFQCWDAEQAIHLQCLAHPHIVSTYDQFISPEGHFVLVMEHAVCNLKSLIAGGTRFSAKDISAIGCQLLSAVHYLHSIGVNHRDISLSNVLWFDGAVVKLADFGISKRVLSSEEMAKTFIGHKCYLPPEILRLGYTTQKSDIYQVGLVLLALMLGREPIPEQMAPKQTRDMILNGAPRQLAEALIPSWGRVAEVVSVMLRRRDEFRYQTALAVWQDLEQEYKFRKLVETVTSNSQKTLGEGGLLSLKPNQLR